MGWDGIIVAGVIIFIIALVAWAMRLLNIKPPKPPIEPPTRYLSITFLGVTGPVTEFSNPDQP